MSNKRSTSVSKFLMISMLLVTISKLTWTLKDRTLIRLKMDPPKGKFHIEAQLTDKINNETFKMDEYLKSDLTSSHGKITFTHRESDLFDIYYNQLDDNIRIIVTQYQNCFYMDRRLATLTTVGRPLLNALLAMGPSIVYRLNDASLEWTKDHLNSSFTMEKMKTSTDNNRLNITVYVEKTDPVDSSTIDSKVIKPLKIIASGTIPEPELGLISAHDSAKNELLIVDSITIKPLDDETLDEIFRPPIRLGCPSLIENNVYPDLEIKGNLHYSAIETSSVSDGKVNGSSRIEIMYNERVKKMLVTRDMENEVDLNKTNCVSLAFDSNDSLSDLIWFSGHFKYQGKTSYKSKGLFDTWESTNYEQVIDGIKYDKVVLTHQFRKAADSTYIPVSSTRFIYNEYFLGQFNLLETKYRAILTFDRNNLMNNQSLTTIDC